MHFFLCSVQTGSGSTQPPIQWILGAISPGIKSPGHDVDQSPPQELCSYTSNPSYVFMALCLDNFTFRPVAASSLAAEPSGFVAEGVTPTVELASGVMVCTQGEYSVPSGPATNVDESIWSKDAQTSQAVLSVWGGPESLGIYFALVLRP
jgi:hypothetical protein